MTSVHGSLHRKDQDKDKDATEHNIHTVVEGEAAVMAGEEGEAAREEEDEGRMRLNRRMCRTHRMSTIMFRRVLMEL